MLWTGTLVNRLGTMVDPFLTLYLTEARGLSFVTTGAVLTIFGIGSLLSNLVGGWLTDRFGRRATLIGGMLAAAAALVTLGYVHTTFAIALTVFGLGATIDTYRPASAAIVADIVSPTDQPRAYGLLYWAINLGFSVAAVVGGTLAHEGFIWLLWVDAVTSVIFALLIWRAIPKIPTETHQDSKRRCDQCGIYFTVLTDRAMTGYMLVTLIFGLIYVQGTTTLPLAVRSEGLPPAAYGTIIGVNGVAVMLAQPFVVSRLGRRDQSHVTAVGMFLLGVGFGLAALAHSQWQFALSVLVWTFGEIMVMTVAQSIVATLAPAHLRGRYNGLHGAAWAIAVLAGPLLGTWLLQSLGDIALWLSCLIMGLAGAAGQMALAPMMRRRASILNHRLGVRIESGQN